MARSAGPGRDRFPHVVGFLMPTLEITTMIGCPLMCTFCPQDKLRDSYGDGEKYMSLDTFARVLAKVPQHVRIDFSGMSEPWANPSATAMLRYALFLGRTVAVYTTLYGMTNADEVIRLLRDYAKQVEIVVVHLPDLRGNMRGWRWTPEYARALSAFVALETLGSPRVSMMTMDDSGRPHLDLEKLNTPIPLVHDWHPNRRADSLTMSEIGEQSVERAVQHSTPVSCSYTPFYDHNVLLPNGDVVLCCMDYSTKHRIGNLLTDNYYDLFASREMGLLRARNTNPSGDTICKKCSRAVTYEQRESKQHWDVVA